MLQNRMANIDLHAKPMVFLDIDGYYSPLRQFLEHSADLGFIPASTMDAIVFETSVDGVLGALKIR